MSGSGPGQRCGLWFSGMAASCLKRAKKSTNLRAQADLRVMESRIKNMHITITSSFRIIGSGHRAFHQMASSAAMIAIVIIDDLKVNRQRRCTMEKYSLFYVATGRGYL
jgi:hypothetical protein